MGSKGSKNLDWNIQYQVLFSLLGGIDEHMLPEVKFIGYEEGEQGRMLMFHDLPQQVFLYYNVEEIKFKKGKKIQDENFVIDM